jgi:hypothetical protein
MSNLRCGQCGAPLAADTTVGSYCPRCRVKFDAKRIIMPSVTWGDRILEFIASVIKPFLIILFLAALIGSALVLRTRVAPIRQFQTKLASSSVAEQVQAVRELIGQPLSLLYQVNKTFCRVFDAADDATKIQMIQLMPEINQYVVTQNPRNRTQLPPEWVERLKQAVAEGSLEVRSAALVALAALPQPAASTEVQPAEQAVQKEAGTK